MLCLFLLHIDYTIYANHVLIKTTMRYKTHYKIKSDLYTLVLYLIEHHSFLGNINCML